jgi:hypothetical protein
MNFFCISAQKDWATNYEIYMKEFDNPVKEHASQESVVRAHNGFHDYMFEPNHQGVKGPNGEDLSQYQEILQEHLIPILKLNLGYKVSRCVSMLILLLLVLFIYLILTLILSSTM